jgi:predicted peroxiredoxin
MPATSRLNVIIAAGPADSSRALLGLAMASAAAADGIQTSVYFAMSGAELVNADNCTTIFVDGFPSVATFVDLIVAAGGDVAYCPSCIGGECSSDVLDKLTRRHACDKASPEGMASYARLLVEAHTVVF